MSKAAWAHALRLVEPALELSDPAFLDQLASRLEEEGVQAAIRRRDTPLLFDWLVAGFQFQGVSDQIAHSYQAGHPLPSWYDISAALAEANCSKLRSYWHFNDCGFRKSRGTCNRGELLPHCPVAHFPFRNGRLSQAAFSFFLFIRDICDGDLVQWLDDRLEKAGLGDGPATPSVMRETLLGPLRQVHGVSDKILSLALSGLLIAGDPRRARWIEAGGAMIAIDTLIHNFLHRSGVLARFGVCHPYGERCYGAGGCAEIIEGLAGRIDVRRFNGAFPANFPRFVQHAVWRFCSASHFDICNGNRINDRHRCQQVFCPAWDHCDKLRLGRG